MKIRFILYFIFYTKLNKKITIKRKENLTILIKEKKNALSHAVILNHHSKEFNVRMFCSGCVCTRAPIIRVGNSLLRINLYVFPRFRELIRRTASFERHTRTKFRHGGRVRSVLIEPSSVYRAAVNSRRPRRSSRGQGEGEEYGQSGAGGERERVRWEGGSKKLDVASIFCVTSLTHIAAHRPCTLRHYISTKCRVAFYLSRAGIRLSSPRPRP